MTVHIVAKELSEAEKRTIEHFRYYFDERRCFALIGEQVVVELAEEHAGSLPELAREAVEKMRALIDTPPDFSTYVMDDEYGLVVMDYGVYGVSRERLTLEEIDSGSMDLAGALAVRSLCLEACERGRILAINEDE